MIPTRLHQKFKDGLVAGFNPFTRSVLCVHLVEHVVDGFDNEDIDAKINETMQHYLIRYTWPVITDLYAIVDHLKIEFKERDLMYFVTRSMVDKDLYGTGEFEKFMIQMRFSSNPNEYYLQSVPDCFYSHREFESYVNEGFLIPVLHINGENCDTY